MLLIMCVKSQSFPELINNCGVKWFAHPQVSKRLEELKVEYEKTIAKPVQP